MEWRPAPLRAGMTVTDEPGLYLEGKFGVRIENTLLIVPAATTPFGEFLGFETLTLAPIDTTPVLPDMLTAEERQWLNSYHRRVRETLSPHLSAAEAAWLRPSPFSLFCRFCSFSRPVGVAVPSRSGMLFPTGRDFCSQGLGIQFPAGWECWKSKFEYPEIIPVSKVYSAWTINPWYKNCGLMYP